MDVDGDIIEDGCDGEVLGGGVTGEKGIGGEMGEGDGVVNEDDKSSTTRITRTIFTDSDAVREGVGWQNTGWFQLCFLQSCYKNILPVKKGG